MALRLGIIGTGLFVLSAAAPALAAEVVISDEARAHFAAGVNLLQDPDGARYEEAYREFKAAYASAPSWKILGNLGISAMKLERDGEAIDAYRKYLAEGGKQIEAEERAQFQRDLATLEAGVVRLTLESDPPGATVEDERFPSSGSAIRNGYQLNGPTQLGVRAGRHRFTARLPGRSDAVWEIELSPKQQLAYTFKLPETGAATAAPTPAAPTPNTAALSSDSVKSSNPLRLGSYVALGVGVVGVAAGTVFGLRAKSKYKEANDYAAEHCPPGNGPCALGDQYGEWNELGKTADRSKTFSIVGFVVGGVGLASGVTLFVLSGKKETPAAARLEPYLGPSSLGMRGSF